PVGSCAYTVTAPFKLCAFASGAVSVTVVGVGTEAIVAVSARAVPFSRMIVLPTARFAVDATVMLVAPAADAARSVGLRLDRVVMALLFPSSSFASPAPPKSHPARVYGTHGPGALRTLPVPPSDGESLLTMLKFGFADGVGGLFAGLPPSAVSVQ